MEGKTQKEQIAYIRKMVATNIRWTERAVLVLYECQTEDEKTTEETTENNARGFTGYDANFLSSLAKRLLEGRPLTAKQLSSCRKALRKYSGQLWRIAQAKGA